jgi:hypothetical protein
VIAVKAKQWIGLISGNTAKLVSPTNPRDVEAIPLMDIAEGEMKEKRLEAAGEDICYVSARLNLGEYLLPNNNARSTMATNAQALRRKPPSVRAESSIHHTITTHFGAQYACINPLVNGNSRSSS